MERPLWIFQESLALEEERRRVRVTEKFDDAVMLALKIKK